MNVSKIKEGLTLILEALEELERIEQLESPQEALPLDAQPEPTQEPKLEAPTPDMVKALLKTLADKHGSSTVRKAVVDLIGEFKPAVQMTDEQRSLIFNEVETHV